MARAKRVDANHGEIKRAFERMGCDVLDLSRVGAGCPDLLVHVRAINRMVLVEVKAPGKKAKGDTKTAQDEFAQRWPVRLVRSIEDAMEAIR